MNSLRRFRLQWRSRENLGIINSQCQRRIIPGFRSYSDSMGAITKICSLKKHRLWMVQWAKRRIIRCGTIIQLNRVRSALWAHRTENFNHRTYWIDVKCRHALHLSKWTCPTTRWWDEHIAKGFFRTHLLTVNVYSTYAPAVDVTLSVDHVSREK